MLRKIMDFRKEILRKGSTYYSIGKDIFDYGKGLVKERLLVKNSSSPDHSQNDESVSRREKLQKNFTMPEPNDFEIRATQESLLNSQGVSDHSGSSYKGPGKPGEKVNANMWQRNFENHQGN